MFSGLARIRAIKIVLPCCYSWPFMLYMLPLSAVLAQPDHAPLNLSDTLTFNDIYASALQQAPEAMETSVRENQAVDFRRVGGSLIAGQPGLQMSYYDDGLLDDIGLQEFEYGVQVPLWRPGQKRDASQLGKSYEVQVEHWKNALAWTVGGRVRQVLGEIATAEADLVLQERAVADVERLREVTSTLFNAGEVARLELMQSESLLVEKQADLLQAQAAMVDAERTYTIITGLLERPAMTLTESLTNEEDIQETHPWLQYLRSNVDLAGALVKQSEHSARGNPTLTLGTRQERPDRFQDSISSVALQLSIPFGGKNFVSSRSSSARRDKVDAEVAWQNAWIELNRQLHEVEHDLFIMDQEEPLRRTQAELSRERFDMALTAFSLGEVTLAQVVIAQQDAQESDRALQMLLADRQRQITQFNQLIGVMP
jgi:cobalt-zinc-cadmium efflux system outer membrane protein